MQGASNQLSKDSLQNVNPMLQQNNLVFSPDRNEMLESRDYTVSTIGNVNINSKQVTNKMLSNSINAAPLSSTKNQQNNGGLANTSRTRRFQESQRTITTGLNNSTVHIGKIPPDGRVDGDASLSQERIMNKSNVAAQSTTNMRQQRK